MNKTKILVIGRHPQILETVVRLINKNPQWHATGASTDAEASALFLQDQYDLVLLGGGIEEASEEKLRQVFKNHNPAIPIVQHYGGGSGLLSNEIYSALGRK